MPVFIVKSWKNSAKDAKSLVTELEYFNNMCITFHIFNRIRKDGLIIPKETRLS